jgi:putative oxidoreductase
MAGCSPGTKRVTPLLETDVVPYTGRMKKKITLAAQFILGLAFFVFGLNGFLNFIPMPKEAIPEKAMKFSMALMESGYFFPFLKGTELVAGLMILLGLYVPVALLVLAPIVLNILLFHTILTPGAHNLPIPLFLVVLLSLAASRHWRHYRPLFKRGY